MNISYNPPTESAFPKHYWLAMSLVVAMWTILGIGTAIA